jgi:uncharacterized lipoprotein YehR (DUF1307 family)
MKKELKMKKIIIVLIAVLFIAGCGKSFCVKIDGTYQDKTGSIEYCYDPSKGVFTDPNGAKALIVTSQELQEVKNQDAEEVTKKGLGMKKIDELLRRVK